MERFKFVAIILGLCWSVGVLMKYVTRYAGRTEPIPAVAPDSTEIGVVGSDYDRLGTLMAILESKNDNDPRLDSGFNNLTPGERKLFRRKYRSLRPELRNERGTIVYLIGKDPRFPDDWSFLREAASEPRCLSLANCAKAGEGAAGIGDDVTLAYPALVALKSAQNILAKDPRNANAISVLEAARYSQAPGVRKFLDRIGFPR